VTAISRAEWSPLAARGATTYEVGHPGGNTTVFLDRESAEAAADEYGGGIFIQWDGRTGHVATTAEYDADSAAWSDRAEPREITGMSILAPARLAMAAHNRLFQEAGHPSSAAG
jgi:hypothetical protein